MNAFPDHAFQSGAGTLSQWAVVDPEPGSRPHLSFAVDLPFRPFELQGEEVSTSLWLGGLDAPVRHWRELAGTEPCDDLYELDGIVRLFGVPNPVEIERLRFGGISGHAIDLELACQIDFEAEGNDEYGVHACQLTARLEVGPLRIAKAIDKRCEGDPHLIRQLLENSIDLTGFEKLEKAAGGWQVPLSAI